MDNYQDARCSFAQRVPIASFSLGTGQNLLYYMAGGEEKLLQKICSPRMKSLQKIQLPSRLFLRKCICPVFIKKDVV